MFSYGNALNWGGFFFIGLYTDRNKLPTRMPR